MGEERQCIACGARLVGPVGPQITLTCVPGEEQSGLQAWVWMCTACGLVHWYGDEESLPVLREVAGEVEADHTAPGTSYERRAQVLRMLRRVRRL